MNLEVRNAAFSYKKGNQIFKNVSFTLNRGEIFSLLGPNGAGKSTLLNCIGNLTDLEEGEILLDGKEISTMSRRNISRKIGYIPQFHNPVFPYLVFDFVLMGRTPYISVFSSPKVEDLAITKRAMEAVGISYMSTKHYNEISGGERQLVMFAKVLAQQPDIILLDEPTSHLDFGNQLRVLSLIENLAKSGFSIIMTSHFPDHAFLLSTKVALMNNHSFANIGPADEVITEKNMRQAFGIDVKIEFIESVNRKICIPMKGSPVPTILSFSKI